MPEIIPNFHPLLVHFPIALISVSAFFHVAAIATRGKPCAMHYAILAHTTLWLGALTALPTAFFGWQASNSVNHDEAGHAAMLIHRAWALSTLAVLAVLASWDAWRNKINAVPVWWFAVAVIGACGMVTTTAWRGGELVYQHGLGVLSLPAVKPDQMHGHAHGSTINDGEHAHADVIHPEDDTHEHSHDKHAH
ncbi:MAG: hypothetical protein A3I83_09430 [Methylotenera sp. RIFCSPLOWO2_02_FULL_45_14]|nr:MAG: hypothetical protein A3I83_09430 [Methylotenera sp. RIFCSPLOWO2_02_FULL_45_14]